MTPNPTPASKQTDPLPGIRLGKGITTTRVGGRVMLLDGGVPFAHVKLGRIHLDGSPMRVGVRTVDAIERNGNGIAIVFKNGTRMLIGGSHRCHPNRHQQGSGFMPSTSQRAP